MEIIVIFGRVIFASFANVLQKKLAIQNHHPLFIVMASYALLSIISLPILLSLPIVHLSEYFWVNIVIAALLDMAGTLFLVFSLSKTDLSIFGPLNAYKIVISMLLAMVFLSEIPSSQGFLGISIIITGSFFLMQGTTKTTNQQSLFMLFTNRGVQYRFLSILLFSTGTLPLKNAVMEGQALTTTIFWCLIGFPLAILSYFLFNKREEQSFFQQAKPVLPELTYLAITLFLMQYLTMIVLSKLLIAYSLALFQFSMVLQVFLGYRVFKEKNIKSRLIACLIMSIGSLLVLKA
tara:strand:+ start:451 stop:1326 length:876 start_codon:yes stop_codon:yes gene_type:complete